PRIWEPIAWILTGINVVSAGFAAVPGQTVHAATHATLAVLFALWAQRLRRQKAAAADASVTDASMAERLSELESRSGEFEKLQDVETRLAELEERLDFTERALVEVRSRTQL